ncbi:MAG: hypothetical protein ABJE95_04240 [Byssovorax sp.]
MSRARILIWIVALSASGCAESVVYHGHSPDRRREIAVVESYGLQRVRVGDQESPRYQGVGIEGLVWSPDGAHLAYPAERKAGWQMVRDGAGGPLWDGIGEVVWSADGAHLAHAANRGSAWLVVDDGKPGPSFDALLEKTLIYSPDGHRLAYVGGRGEARFVVEGGRVGPGWDGVAGLAFSADSAHLAYTARRGDKIAFVLDGAVSPEHDTIASLALSPHGDRSAYVALHEHDAGNGRKTRTWSAVVDGVAGPEYDRISSLGFDGTGAHVAYAARRGTREFVVEDGREGPPLDGIMPLGLGFTAEGAHLIYVARSAGRPRVVEDGVEGPPLDAIEPPVFAPRGDRWAALATLGAARFVLTDRGPGRPFAWIGGPTWSDDGAQIGYLARRGSQSVVVHGADLTALDGAVEGSLVLGEKGRWACVAAYPAARRFYVVIDGIPRVPFDMDELTAEVARRPYGELLGGAEGAIFRRWVSAELKKR